MLVDCVNNIVKRCNIVQYLRQANHWSSRRP